MKTLEKEIIATLAFFNSFEKALTVEEVFENLYRQDTLSEKPTISAIQNSLESLKEKGQITSKDAKIHLKGVGTLDRSQSNQKLIDKTLRWAWIFKLCPFIDLVAVCNTLGFNAAKKGSDIDLFIVTSSGKLFTGRTFITLLTQIFGLRRHGKKIKERFCLSFLVDKSSEDVFKLANKEAVYFTYWLKNLRVMYARNSEAVEDLAASNKYWVSQYLHHPKFNTEEIKEGKNIIGKFIEFLLNGGTGEMIENRLKTWQLKRAKGKAAELQDLSGTVLSETILKFHDIDRRSEIHRRWEQTIGDL